MVIILYGVMKYMSGGVKMFLKLRRKTMNPTRINKIFELYIQIVVLFETPDNRYFQNYQGAFDWCKEKGLDIADIVKYEKEKR
jgi:hypothetical protein